MVGGVPRRTARYPRVSNSVGATPAWTGPLASRRRQGLPHLPEYRWTGAGDPQAADGRAGSGDPLAVFEEVLPRVRLSRENCSVRIVLGPDAGPEVLPPERGGDSGARRGPEAVRGDHRFAGGVLEVVDEDRPLLAGARELGDDVRGVLRDGFSDVVRELPERVERVAGRERDDDVQPLLPRGLDERPEPALVQAVADDTGDLDHAVERERRLGVDVDEEQVGGVVRPGPREGRVELERGDIREPDDGVEIVAEDEVDVPARGLGPVGEGLDERGRAGRRVLLVEPLLPDATGEAVHGYRPVAEVREEERGDPEVVLDHVQLRKARFRVEHPVGVGDLGLGLLPDCLHPRVLVACHRG